MLNHYTILQLLICMVLWSYTQSQTVQTGVLLYEMNSKRYCPDDYISSAQEVSQTVTAQQAVDTGCGIFTITNTSSVYTASTSKGYLSVQPYGTAFSISYSSQAQGSQFQVSDGTSDASLGNTGRRINILSNVTKCLYVGTPASCPNLKVQTCSSSYQHWYFLETASSLPAAASTDDLATNCFAKGYLLIYEHNSETVPTFWCDIKHTKVATMTGNNPVDKTKITQAGCGTYTVYASKQTAGLFYIKSDIHDAFMTFTHTLEFIKYNPGPNHGFTFTSANRTLAELLDTSFRKTLLSWTGDMGNKVTTASCLLSQLITTSNGRKCNNIVFLEDTSLSPTGDKSCPTSSGSSSMGSSSVCGSLRAGHLTFTYLNKYYCIDLDFVSQKELGISQPSAEVMSLNCSVFAFISAGRNDQYYIMAVNGSGYMHRDQSQAGIAYSSSAQQKFSFSAKNRHLSDLNNTTARFIHTCDNSGSEGTYFLHSTSSKQVHLSSANENLCHMAWYFVEVSTPDACAVNNCKNGGQCCTGSDTLPYCICSNGYTGTLCESIIQSGSQAQGSMTSLPVQALLSILLLLLYY